MFRSLCGWSKLARIFHRTDRTETLPPYPILICTTFGISAENFMLLSTDARFLQFQQLMECTTLEWSALETIVSSRGGWRLICLDSNAHHPALLRRFVTLAPSINVMTYLFTYLVAYCMCMVRANNIAMIELTSEAPVLLPIALTATVRYWTLNCAVQH